MSSLPPRSAQHVIYDNILDTIGRTPLVRLNRIARGLRCTLVAKVEFFNPGGSVKDRIALNIVEAAEREGRLKPGGTIVEGTSGNTGVGLAIVAAIKGYKTVFVMPDKMSTEKIRLLRAFGAKVVITPTAVAPDDERSYYKVSEHIVAETPNAILATQYHNPENPRSHYLTTGPEIWEQTGGHVTDVIIGMGTGGTITGAGRYLKEKNPKIRIVGVDPAGSLLYETHKLGRLPDDPRPKTYKTEGIGEDFLPTALDLSVVDEVIQVGDKETFLTTRRLVREEGIFCGGSSGAALAGAVKYAQGLGPERLVVVLLPDSGTRYLSKIFDDDWMREHGFLELDRRRATALQVAQARGLPMLVTAQPGDKVSVVVGRMRADAVSQLPVVDDSGALVGLVTEVDLLRHLLTGGSEAAEHTVAQLAGPEVRAVPADTPFEDILPDLTGAKVVVLVDEAGRPRGILTMIDALEFLAA